ncbi:MAG TPA: hypothetical protein VGF80_12850 [Galbitalea sp.]|jgi:hypothetical protein
MTDTNETGSLDNTDTYTAELVSPDGTTETVELEFVEGLPRKSFVRATPGAEDDDTKDVTWELDEGADEVFRYEQAPEQL